MKNEDNLEQKNLTAEDRWALLSDNNAIEVLQYFA